MTNRGKAGGVVAAAALLVPPVLWAVGRVESRDGGRAVAADVLNRPWAMLGVAAVLLLAAVVVRGRWDVVGGVAAAFAVVGLLLAGGKHLLLPFGPKVQEVSRAASPQRADHVLRVAHHDDPEGYDGTYVIRVEAGSGLSTRRWDVIRLRNGGFLGQGMFVSAEWSGADRIRITTDAGHRVFTVDQATGKPVLTESVGELKSVV
ncbi:hypothetical protein AB0E96_29285 [Kitasatospora sp. NPDC036755]|uniref:hypothetical protein n=1 Tax=Kitasatospora sp. NPDC036755 TaxID=3154600 RepID=UPI00340C3CFC